MTLAPGSRFGPYEVISPLGAGGMGEVYRARDAKLNRDVAIKVLPEALARDSAALARFELEAKAVAALSHPNILSIFDFGSHEGIAFAVTELLEGETLRAKLASGPLPEQKAIEFGSQIARGLAAAHEKGIVHRDLKPENLFVTNDGHVKILDFGLARLVTTPAEAGDTKSPTLARLTEAGAIVGTVAYMSPEQVRGVPADHRSDIFSFGSVLYELLAGRRPFSGESAAETMYAIVREEPAELEAAASLSRVVKTCLAKEPRERWQSAGDLARELSWIGEGTRTRAARPGAKRRPRAVASLPWILAGLLSVAVVLEPRVSTKTASVARSVVRFSVLPPAKTFFERNVLGDAFAPSPDARTIAFMANAGGRAVLWLWSVSEETAREVADTDGAISPFWSPDGSSLAFFADGKLKKVAVSGGPAQVLSDAPFGHSGSWGSKGDILFSEWSGPREGIYRIPAEGGTPSKLTLVDGEDAAMSRAWPFFLPDGIHFLYMTGAFRGLAQNYRTCVGRLGSQNAVCLIQSDTRARYAPPGRLLFVRKGTLLAQRFDTVKLRVSGEPMPVADRVSVFAPTGGADFAVSADGDLLVYRRGAPPSRLVWMDRTGRQVGSVGQPGFFGLVRISPDEKRLAADVEDPATGGRDVWLYDLLTGIGSRLTFDPVDAGWPVWSPDGRQIVFGSGGKGPPDIYVKDLFGRLEERLVLAAPSTQFPGDWSRDGRFIAYVDYSPTRKAQRQVLLVAGSGKAEPTPLIGSDFSQYDPRFSLDSRSIAFVSEESGAAEVYVAAVDGAGRRQRVSPAGGSLPCWSRDGKELFFVSTDSVLMTVRVIPGRDLSFAEAKPLFSLPAFPFRFRSDYDVSADGQRFLVNLGTDSARQPPLTVVLGWQQRLVGI